LLSDEPKVGAGLYEVHVKTLIASSEVITEAVASKVFEIDAPPVFARQVGSKVVLSLRRPLADSCDVLANVGRQDVYMLVIPGRV
jgi:hypothetical protein